MRPPRGHLKLEDLRSRATGVHPEHCPLWVGSLEPDTRKGARELAVKLERRWQGWLQMELALRERADFERQVRRGEVFLAGVDEVGRGPLAGPVVAACVVMPAGWRFPGIGDSKDLSARQREDLFGLISSRCLDLGLGLVGPAHVDRVNIMQASLLAMRKAVLSLSLEPDLILVDGNCIIPGISPRQEAEVAGDRRLPSVSAASVVAKVMRDRLMAGYDKQYPGYGFRRNKGYASVEHREALKRLGPSPVHRLSFLHPEQPRQLSLKLPPTSSSG